jgi:hypothetical protein
LKENTMNQLECLNLQSFLREKIKDVNLHKKAISIALGIAISRMVPIPSSAVDSAESHFLFNVKTTASEIMSQFNEAIVVDVELVNETVRTYWLIRYANAYPDANIPMLASGEHCFLTKLAGAGRYLNADTHAFCEQHSQVMVTLCNRITRILREKEVV